MAELFAVCPQRWGLQKVDYLYTFGAPAVSTTPLQDDGACFQGARMFNLDTDSYDPFADLGTWAGYVHPRMQAIQLLPMGSKKTDIYQQVSYDCWDENTPYLPGANYASLS
ncbi:unnamed protein product, partial [Symbiodinium pilosum]